MKLSRILTFLAIAGIIFSCSKDEFNFNDLSNDVKLDRVIAIPLVKADLIFEELSGERFDSLLISGEDTIKLYLIEGIEETDTMAMGDQLENMRFDYLNLHHTFRNMFPVGVDVQLFLHDSIADENIDTVFLASNPGELLLEPAPVDEDGLVIEDQVESVTDVAALDTETLFNLTDRTTHLIFSVYVPPTEGYVKILDHYSLIFKIGLEAEGEYTTSLDSDN